MHLQAGALLKNGEYKIEKVLGQGGFGITYLAEQTSLGRKVALKEFFMDGLCNRDAATSHVSVPSVGSKKLVERFKQKFIKEARMIASFDNSHIISIHDVFEENGTAYYVMEYLGGKSLSAIVNEQGIMSETLAMKYIRQVADALAEVHANNLLHLDVKPANIMLNKKGEAVLIDFGISKHYDEAGNQTSSALIGTSEGYAPIEQYEAGALDSFTPATDIYALGATLFFLLTGTRPPKAGDVMNDGLPELPSEISQTVSGAITAAMQPRRKDRPQSIAEFLCLVESGNVKGENGKLKDESDGETELNGNVKAASKREGENLFTHTASESSFDEVKGENGKLVADEFHSIDVVEVPDSADGNVILSVSEESHSADAVISNGGEKSHSADAVIFRGKPSTARLSVSEESQPANNEILPPYSRQNDKDAKKEGEMRNEKEHSAGAVISNESEKSQKNKPGKSLWLILLLLLIAVAGAWFMFGGTGDSSAVDVKKDSKKLELNKLEAQNNLEVQNKVEEHKEKNGKENVLNASDDELAMQEKIRKDRNIAIDAAKKALRLYVPNFRVGFTYPIFFKPESEELEERNKQVLKYMAQYFKSFPTVYPQEIRVCGFTGPNGSIEFNDMLSQRRSDIVAKIFRDCGINNVESISMGETEEYENDCNERVDISCTGYIAPVYVFFGKNSCNLSNKDLILLENLAECACSGNFKLFVRAFSGTAGGLEMSKKRAKKVFDAIRKYGAVVELPNEYAFVADGLTPALSDNCVIVSLCE